MSSRVPTEMGVRKESVRMEAVPGWLRDHSSRIVTAAIVLALLYLGRSVLIPLALAIMLSLLVAPLVRAVRRVGVGRTASVFVAIGVLTFSFIAIAVALGTQMLRIAESLPQYESNIQGKLNTLNEVTVERLRPVASEASHLVQLRDVADQVPAQLHDSEPSKPAIAPTGTAADLTPARTQPLQLMRKLATNIWGPLQFAGIVFLVLIFVLLEHESLRDRFIRIAGATDIRMATLALNDASERLSRYFVSQFVVNLAFGVSICIGLSLLRLPQALLCGMLAGVLRFVPYAGVGLAAVFAAVLALAVDPGWSLAITTVCLFILLDVVVGQLVEPHLYGHATGLSPLSVVVSAIFWSWLWGPAGLILSTPLTLCLLVAGRHMQGLGVLELLLGNAQPLTLPQRFYQRALCGDPHEIMVNAREFLKHDSLAAYADQVMIPALHLARLDAEAGATTEAQQQKIRRVILDVAAALSGDSLKLVKQRHRGAVLEEVNAGRWLRKQREELSGRWQGPLGVPPGSIVIGVGLGSPADDLTTEVLVRLLRKEGIDARHFSPADIEVGLPPGADPDGVAMVFVVSAFPSVERKRADPVSRQLQELFPRATIIRVCSPGVAPPAARAEEADSGTAAGSLEEAVDIALSWQRVRSRSKFERLDPQRAVTVCS
ncbi:MAG TPA: AI-2E family transporter [Steroidobacteraceae bacterium]|nr:AI-2E family transporter [Steroidobacteraceae bacterium]